MKQNFLWLCTTLLCLLGCAGGDGGPPGTSLERVSVVSAHDLNQRSALRLQLVCVYDKKLLDHLKTMSAAQYFTVADQLLRDNPKNLSVMHWELIPAQVLEDYTPAIDRADEVYGILIFADYHSKGNHRMAVKEDVEHARIILAKSSIKTIETVKDQPLTGKASLVLYPQNATVLPDSSMSTEAKAQAEEDTIGE